MYPIEPIKHIKGDGDWSIEKHQFKIPYHPKNNAKADCVIGVCRSRGMVVGVIATIRKIAAPYNADKYEYAIQLILHEMIILHFFGKEEIEIPF
jgi:ADP-heptose:LPS heptosyltransferase